MSGEFIKNLGCCEATIGRSPLFPYKRMFIRKKKPFVKNGYDGCNSLRQVSAN